MAKQVVALEVTANSSQAEGSVKSLKAQLREAQAEVAAMADKFGDTSQQAADAARKAAELKDKIGDAKALTDAFSPDKKFAAFAGALQGVAGGFAAVQGAMGLMGVESDKVEQTLLKVQSAMAMVQGLNAITESIDAFKNLGTVLSNVSIVQKASAVAQRIWNAAMSANPIGAIIVAITALIAGIVALVKWFKASSDAAQAQTKAVNESAKAIANQKKAMDEANQTLDRNQKQQLAMAKATGKSADEIRKLERSLINKKVADAEAASVAALHTVELEKQRLAALRTADADDEIIKKQEENLKSARDNLKTANDNVIKAGNERIDLINRQQVEIAQAETDANKKRNEDGQKKSDERKKQAEDEAKAIIDATKQMIAETKKLNDENFIASIKDERARAEAKITLDYTNKIREITSSKASAEAKAEALKQVEIKYGLDIQALKDKNAEEDRKKADEKAKADLAKEAETNKMLTDARINAIKDENVKRQELEAQRYQDEIDKQLELLNTKQITDEDYKLRREAIEQQHQTNLTAIEKQNADARVKTSEEEAKAKLAHIQSYGDSLGKLSDIVGKQTAVGKSLGIAQALINTYTGATEVLRAKSVLPEPAGTIAKIVNVAAIIASGIKAVKEITKVKVPGTGGGGGGGGTPPSVSAPIAPQMSQTALNQQMVNQMGNAATRAFVLESDVSGNQERIRRLNRAARIN